MNQPLANIQPIIDGILAYQNSVGGIDRQKIESFIRSNVNGDILIGFIVIDGVFGKDDESCVIIYVLTNGKLLKVRIEKNNKFTATGVFLNQITKVEKTLQPDEGEGESAKAIVDFTQGRFNLIYYPPFNEIDGFFQKVDQAVQRQRGSNAA